MKSVLLLLVAPIILMAHKPLNNKTNDVNNTSFKKNITHCNTFKKDAKKIAEYYRQRVIRGESMSSIAKIYSEGPGSANNGGQYDGVVKGMMVAEFEAVAFRLKPNEISEVFETQYGFHFIQLISRKGDVLSLRHILITRD
jgi:peptidyl-prolyl cis-trans isomerase SurA